MIFSRTAKYLNYILLSHHRKGHGIHSPFVFDLVSRVFRHKIDPSCFSGIEQIRKKMKGDKRRIRITDLGAKSRLMKKNMRRVSDIGRHSAVTQKYGRLLSNLSGEFGDALIIELGTSLGISTMYLALNQTKKTIYTIEGCLETAAIARQNFSDAGFSNIKLLEGSFDNVLPDLASSSCKPGLVFIDGNHRKQPVLKYFNILADMADSNTVIVIDDINYSKEMREAWDELIHHNKVSVSIDIFRMGILFFREGITHNNYVIRY